MLLKYFSFLYFTLKIDKKIKDQILNSILNFKWKTVEYIIKCKRENVLKII